MVKRETGLVLIAIRCKEDRVKIETIDHRVFCKVAGMFAVRESDARRAGLLENIHCALTKSRFSSGKDNKILAQNRKQEENQRLSKNYKWSRKAMEGFDEMFNNLL